MPNRRDTLLFFYKRRPDRRPAGYRVDPRTVGYFIVMILLIGLAGWLYLHQASEAAGYAHEIRELERRRERLGREIVALRADVAKLGSLERILSVGEELGYSLPEASDMARRLRVEYPVMPDPAPAPVADIGQGTVDRVAEPKGILHTLQRQLEEWLESP
ncbi:MAG TPA: hypothetical protein GX702_03340 [Chloroflexi bacterium]|jgi:hypothetical protein|nr:hypothetical protein [Chloroflexota bacterium]